MMLESLARPVIFAHRGASAYAPENTIAAFELALAQQADAIELDVKLSADGYVIVHHDATVDRTTNGKGRVKDLTLDELKKLDAGSFFSETFKGQTVPTLEEVFEAVGMHTFINVELTNYNTPRDHLVETVCMLVKKHEMQKHVIELVEGAQISARCAARFVSAQWLAGSMGALLRVCLWKVPGAPSLFERHDSAASLTCPSFESAHPCLDGEQARRYASSISLGGRWNFHR
jgi:hypothetical protein